MHKKCLECGLIYSRNEYPCPSCNSTSHVLVETLEPVPAEIDQSETPAQKNACEFCSRAVPVLTILNGIGAAVSVTASALMAVIPLPLVIIALFALIPVAGLNLVGITVSLFATFKCRPISGAKALLLFSLIPVPVFLICFQIGKSQ